MRRLMVRLIPLAWACGLACGASPGATSLPLELSVRARALAPGEPVRVLVSSPAPLLSLSIEFLDQRVSMMRLDRATGEQPERWSGWAIIALDRQPGAATIEARGATVDGREALGTQAVTIAAKEFPTEELTVAPKYVTPPPEVEQRLERERAKLAALYRRRTVLRPPSEPFIRPVPDEPSSVFGTRRLFNGEPRSPHPGLDLRASSGTPVHASGPGEVVLAEDLYYSGNVVIIDHGGGLFTLYAHLSLIQVGEGDRIERGQLLGLSGATGRVTGPHLHWGAKIGDRPFDPVALTAAELFR